MAIGNISGSVSPNTRIKDFDVVLSNLNREIKKIEGNSLRGLILVSAFIRNETEHKPPLTPVDLGNLRSSWFTVTAEGRGKEDRHNKPFVGPKRGVYTSEHQSTIEECRGLVIGNEKSKKGKYLMMGYSVNYALYVHEMQGARFKRHGANAKWFQTAVMRNRDKILEIVRENAKIGK